VRLRVRGVCGGTHALRVGGLDCVFPSLSNCFHALMTMTCTPLASLPD
jgi:hypothetical protein